MGPVFTKAGSKRVRRVPDRDPSASPRKRPKDHPDAGGVVVGGGGWAGTKRNAAGVAEEIMKKREERKKKTKVLVEKGAHHLTDTVGPEGVRPAAVTDVVIDFVAAATGMDDGSD